MTVDDLLTQLGHEIGLPLAWDAQRCCRLIFDGATSVDLEWLDEIPPRLVLHACVGAMPQGDDLGLYELLLTANCFGRGTGEAVLSLDSARGEVLLHRFVSLPGLDLPAFIAGLEDFVARTKQWTQTLADRPATDAASLEAFALRA